jgi:hypothetical protein
MCGEKDLALVDELGSMCTATYRCQLGREDYQSRGDLIVYEELDADTKSWDTKAAEGMARYLLGGEKTWTTNNAD